MSGCAPCVIDEERSYCKGCGLPFRVPGRVQLPARPGPRLSYDDFTDGWLKLKAFVRVPVIPSAQAVYYDLVKWSIDRRGWERAVNETIRTAESSRLPSPEQMIARSGYEKPKSDIDPHAGRWVFRCSECRYSFMTQARDLHEPPATCTRCQEAQSRAEWWQ